MAVSHHIPTPTNLVSEKTLSEWHSSSLIRACDALAEEVHDDWVWWPLGITPEAKMKELIDIIDRSDTNVPRYSADETQRLVRMMVPTSQARLVKTQESGETVIDSPYLRICKEKGVNQQWAEVTSSTVLGCLRIPKGGASCPCIIIVNGNQAKTRLLSVEEAAALMGLPDDFILPTAYQPASKVIGGGFAASAVRFLAERILGPLAIAVRNDERRMEDKHK